MKKYIPCNSTYEIEDKKIPCILEKGHKGSHEQSITISWTDEKLITKKVRKRYDSLVKAGLIHKKEQELDPPPRYDDIYYEAVSKMNLSDDY